MKLSQICLIFISFFMVACGGDDGLDPDTSLIGTWEAQSFTADMETSTDFSGATIEATSNIEGENLNYNLTFSDAAYTTEGAYGIKGEVVVDGSTTNLDQTYTDVSGDGTYTLDGDQLTSNGAFFDIQVNGMDLSAAQGELTVTIEKLSATELIISQDTEETITQTQGGTEIKITAKLKARSVWKRK